MIYTHITALRLTHTHDCTTELHGNSSPSAHNDRLDFVEATTLTEKTVVKGKQTLEIDKKTFIEIRECRTTQ